jgi:hypothetical protein
MKLQDRLDDIKRQFELNAPLETKTLMHQSTEDLIQSGIMEKVLKTGDALPEFTLPDAHGNLFSSQALVDKGPLVVSFYRGVY